MGSPPATLLRLSALARRCALPDRALCPTESGARKEGVSLIRLFLFLVLLLAVATGCAQYTTDVPEARGPLGGSWVMTEIAVISERGENRYPDPAPGLFIFDKIHYSMVWMPLTEVPPDFEEIWRPTEEEKAAAYSSIVVNSGTYTYTDTTVTTVPTVAKTPEFIGGYAVYTYRVEGDTLWMDMTDTVSRDGVQDPGVGLFRMPLKLIRAE